MVFDLAAAVERERALVPSEVLAVPSMLSYEERALLHWAAREGFEVEGAVVDAGSFLGGSTLALAHGVTSSRRDAGRLVHAFDRFEVDGEYARGYFDDDFPFAVGASTFDVFERYVAPVRERVVVHRGDLLDFTWYGEPISTLFIDIAKSFATNEHVVTQFFPSVRVDALIIQQDLVHWGHPWCAMTMELLSDYVEFLGHVYYGSAVYRLTRLIPADAVPLGLLARLTADDALTLVDRCAARVGEPQAANVALAGAAALASFGEFARARERLASVQCVYDDVSVPYISQGFDWVRVRIDRLERGTATVE